MLEMQLLGTPAVGALLQDQRGYSEDQDAISIHATRQSSKHLAHRSGAQGDAECGSGHDSGVQGGGVAQVECWAILGGILRSPMQLARRTQSGAGVAVVPAALDVMPRDAAGRRGRDTRWRRHSS